MAPPWTVVCLSPASARHTAGAPVCRRHGRAPSGGAGPGRGCSGGRLRLTRGFSRQSPRGQAHTLPCSPAWHLCSDPVSPLHGPAGHSDVALDLRLPAQSTCPQGRSVRKGRAASPHFSDENSDAQTVAHRLCQFYLNQGSRLLALRREALNTRPLPGALHLGRRPGAACQARPPDIHRHSLRSLSLVLNPWGSREC